ncbi:very short patch repair endonuclease [Stenotrophomonas maltophilia]|uniref:Very short patch repair endonuclease n=1 Tax=Stenotrophomonas maltophilia TaxID=40324 RepID=A0AAI9FTA0_STEMA|nr:very short patch repair endonuclease [Stenotrophomonas maltophilia]UUS15549.1 very short patch repair endonuclease [Stenotrophomonas sp. CD2]AWT13132.1 very short patch repair endonuclease [Stenotrophomonas maltophilia]EKT4093458.1 DNA mismatch endonuclease Vsr [Stenotrophomonas maltophilia]MBA0362082.1 DNA mismatch endonuclease Vsr [Stenotrophomonas maltophilia]HEL4102323.1 DNA mismatch endonuclease Vsr [Stenotrophomonas maltophilia]
MVDSLTPEQRSAQMSRIRGSNTKLEVLVRKGLHARGLRYRLGGARLPGRPDIVLPKYHAVVFVHGCFWHGHDCPLYRLPKTRPEFWSDKIDKNKARDQRVVQQLESLGWRVLTVWECSLRGVRALDQALFLDSLAKDIQNSAA